MRRYKWLFDPSGRKYGSRYENGSEYSLIVRPDFHKLKENIKDLPKSESLMVLGPTGDQYSVLNPFILFYCVHGGRDWYEL